MAVQNRIRPSSRSSDGGILNKGRDAGRALGGQGYSGVGKDRRVTDRIRGCSGRGQAWGFSLVELLVAMAIFTTIMGGVGALFISSVRIVRQGFQNQEAFELARGTLNIIESDLSRAFTSREHGDNYKFYGTPIGFSFVGIVGQGQGSGAGNLARVTYVVYHGPDANLGVLTSTKELPRPTFKLLRYVEPNREDLNDFPVEWYNTRLVGEGSRTLSDLIDDAFSVRYDNGNIAGGYNPYTEEPLNSQQTKEAVNAKKRELWIRMLSGGDQIVPSAWDPAYQISSDNTFGWVDLGAIHDRTWQFYDPHEIADDYVVAENLLHVYRHPGLSGNFDENGIPIDDDGDGVPNEPGEQLILNGWPTIFDSETVSFNPTAGIPFPTHYFSYREFRSRERWFNGYLQSDEFGKPIADIVPVDSRFWNDMRNASAFADGQDFTTGSPLTPALPQMVSTFFTFFFESPEVNVPDFMRDFDQRIDIPTGYRRLPPL